MMAPNNFQVSYPIVKPPGYSSQGYRAAQSMYAPPSNHSSSAFGNFWQDLYRADNRTSNTVHSKCGQHLGRKLRV
jgi:hypothetical protein